MGCCDFALSAFGAEQDWPEAVRQILVSDWRFQFEQWNQPPWAYVWRSGLVSDAGAMGGWEVADPGGDEEADSAGIAVFGCPGAFSLLEDVTPAPSWPRGMMREILVSELRRWLKLETLAITAPGGTGGSSGD